MKLAIASDFCASTGDPAPYLRHIAEAGFTHIHWCHQWCTDFLYSKYEIAEYKRLFKELGLTLLDVHGSAGYEKYWCSPVEYIRKSGVELVANRLHMMAEMEATGCLMMHIPYTRTDHSAEQQREIADSSLPNIRKTLDELMPLAQKYGIRIAVENMWMDSFGIIAQLMKEYSPDYLGITYDSGHGNGGENPQGLNFMEQLKDRLYALHLHDNDGSGDQHQPPFMGNVDWTRMAKIIATGGYDKNSPVSFEMSMRNTPFFDVARSEERQPQTDDAIRTFLADARQRCERFAKMVNAERV